MRRAAPAAVALSLVAVKFFPAPYVWTCLTWGAVAIAWAIATQRTGSKMAAIALATVVLTIASAEVWLWVRPQRLPVVYTFTPQRQVPDSLLGWRLAPSQVTRATASVGDQLIYDVRYTTDSAGRRKAPPDRGERVEGCVLFFADSFTFGDGLQDEQTLPYRVGVRANGRFRVVDFSVPAWGAEQMLASIEHGLLERPGTCKPTHVIYVALPAHVARAAGKTAFSVKGPHYEVGPQGVPVYVGTPWPAPVPPPAAWRPFLEWAQEQLDKSRLYQLARHREPVGSDGDLRRYLAIVRRARDLLSAQYPGVGFHVLNWNTGDFYPPRFNQRFDAGLANITPNVHGVLGLLPRFRDNPQVYLIRFDRHPNALANDLLAAYVVQHILPPQGSSPRQERR